LTHDLISEGDKGNEGKSRLTTNLKQHYNQFFRSDQFWQLLRRRDGAKIKKPITRMSLMIPAAAGENLIPGNVLLSHTVTHAVPSALKGLTSVFGMGTGVSPSPWSPRNLEP
jgi:hypothetical protein